MMIFCVGLQLDLPSSPGRCWHCCLQPFNKDIATAPADSYPIDTCLLYLKDLYSMGKILQKHYFTVEGKDPDFKGVFYFRFISSIAWEQCIAVCWRQGRTGTSRC